MHSSHALRALVTGLVAAQLILAAAGIGTAAAASVKPAQPKTTQRIVLAGGCFWGMEAVFERLKGVSNVVAGYSGGDASSAHYEMVSTGTTGHAESVEVTFDPAQISFSQLLAVYFLVAHDPTELNRQGPDDGSQYRSEIYYTTDAQKSASESYIQALTAQKTFDAKIVTLVAPLRAFYPAEAEHQHFVTRNPYYPYVVINDLPKLAELKRKFPDMVKS
jgi:peptide-methionine (S)-S-oxide reductase